MAMSMPGGGGGRSGRGRRDGRSRSAPMAEINVTPLVDVMLVLLIIFMVTAPLMNNSVPMDLPESNAKPMNQPEKQPVQISVAADGQVYIDDEAVTMDALPARLGDVASRADAEDLTVVLRGDRNINYGTIMQVMGELNNAGLNKLQMVSNSPSNGQ